MEKVIKIPDPAQALLLYGPADRNLRTVRHELNVQIYARENLVTITGEPDRVIKAEQILNRLLPIASGHTPVTPADVEEAITSAKTMRGETNVLDVYTASCQIRPRTKGQEGYMHAIKSSDMVFCTGPAGTGKTYLAVAFAVHMLKHHTARRLILARPAVEAGEKLGFLPGDLQAKVNPYLRPLFDALHDMMDFDQIRRFMVDDLIEVIPLAFMRGRTLNDSVIILDEAQNTTPKQMLMFLTRMGNGSKMIITGDISQTDLDNDTPSGLLDAMNRLDGIEGLSFVRLAKQDIIRHSLVQNVVRAYEGQNN